jgi:ferredoxin-NADP reductase
MWKLPLLTAFVAGIGLVSPVIAQDIASLPDAKSSYLVFADRNGRLSPVAIEMVRNAAHAAGPIYLSGPAPYVETVNKQLIREGVPATAISVRTTAPSLPATQDGISSPEDRGVQIRF